MVGGPEDLLRPLNAGISRVARSLVACGPSLNGSSLSWLILNMDKEKETQITEPSQEEAPICPSSLLTPMVPWKGGLRLSQGETQGTNSYLFQLHFQARGLSSVTSQGL